MNIENYDRNIFLYIEYATAHGRNQNQYNKNKSAILETVKTI